MIKQFNPVKSIFSHATLLALALFSTTSLAAEGLYIGGGANYNWLNADYSINNYIIDSFFGYEDVGHNSGDFSGDNAGGQVVAGYTWRFPNQIYFVSLEGFAEFYSIKGKAHWESPQVTITLNQSLAAQLKNGFGVSLKPGVALTDKVSVFGLVGYVHSEIDDVTYNTGLTLFNNDGISEFKQKGLDGLRLGFGGQYNLTENLITELSWAINLYQDYDYLNQYITGQQGGSIYYEKVELNSIKNNQLFLNFILYFD